MFIFPSGTAGYTINRSLRFRSSASAYLSRTFSAPTNQAKWTWSGWVKRGSLTSVQRIFSTGTTASDTATFVCFFSSTDTIALSGWSTIFRSTNAVFRDPSAWLHLVVACDTTQGTEANKLLVYVNGVAQTFATTNAITTCGYNTAAASQLGALATTGFLDGYLSEINFVDGQQLTPTSFGYTDSYGVWKPKAYTGTYGTNGFYLPFSDGTSTTTLTQDRSGNSNNWTATNVSLTAGVTYDWMVDTPSVNYAVLNPLDSSSASNTVSGANLNATITSSASLRGSIYVSTGKWYYEVTVNTLQNLYLGLASNAGRPTNYTATSAFGVNNAGDFYEDNTLQTEDSIALAAGAVYGIAFDATAKRFWIAKDGQWYSCDRTPDITISASDIESGNFGYDFSTLTGDLFSPHFGNSTTAGAAVSVNFGQRPFTYTPPTGFKALNTANLPVPVIRNPKQYMDVKLRSGTGASTTITGIQFQPDLVWVKARSAATDHKLTDVVRGVTKALISDTTGAETTDTNGLTAFTSDGYTIGSDTVYNNSTGPVTYVDWLWRANGTGVTNTAGSITSTVSANTTSGFAIVTYTGTGANATVGHGLGVAPKMVIVKTRSLAGENWPVYHASIASPASNQLRLNATTASEASTNWNSTSPTSAVFSIGSGNPVGANTQTYVAYCFAEVPGFSKFGSYTGNGSADGPFVYCGFRPRWVMVKQSSAAGEGWAIFDTARNEYNVIGGVFSANAATAEGTATYLDITSNGFKLRTTSASVNANTATYIFAAFAEFPFSMSLAR